MATITDGTTEVEIEFADETNISTIDDAGATTVGGRLKQQQSGERLKLRVKAAITPTVYRSLLDLLKNPTLESLFYTPEEEYDLYDDLDSPFAARITDLKNNWDNRGIYYIEFLVEAVDYL